MNYSEHEAHDGFLNVLLFQFQGKSRPYRDTTVLSNCFAALRVSFVVVWDKYTYEKPLNVVRIFTLCRRGREGRWCST